MHRQKITMQMCIFKVDCFHLLITTLHLIDEVYFIRGEMQYLDTDEKSYWDGCSDFGLISTGYVLEILILIYLLNIQS